MKNGIHAFAYGSLQISIIFQQISYGLSLIHSSGLGIKFLTYTRSIGPVTINEVNFDAHEIYNNSLYMPDADAALKASEYLEECLKSLNSSGGVCECCLLYTSRCV